MNLLDPVFELNPLGDFGHVPDLRGLTDAFRNWCEAKGIPLDAQGIDRTFVGFCKNYRPII